MKIKAVLRSLFLAYALTGICLLLLGIIVIYVISCMAGGFLAGKITRREKYRWGALVGLSYFILLGTVSFIVSGSWDMSPGHMITTLCMCLGGGTLGGMLS